MEAVLWAVVLGGLLFAASQPASAEAPVDVDIDLGDTPDEASERDPAACVPIVSDTLSRCIAAA